MNKLVWVRWSSLRAAGMGIFLMAMAVRGVERDVILEWNALMLDAIRADNSGPTLSTRNLAILHTAMFDAVNSVVRTHQPYQFLFDAPEGTSAEAAAVAAGYTVMNTLYQTLGARTRDLYDVYVEGALGDPGLTNGLSLGRVIGESTLQSREADGSQTEVVYIPSDLPGQWRRTPPFFRPPLTPHWRYVTPFCIPALDPFMPPPPPPLDSPEYARDVDDVKALGSKTSSVRTAEQSEIAVFWSDFSYTAMPPGHWHEIAATIVQSRETSLVDTSRLFALLSVAQADAAIVCWETKFRYNIWRPITSIRRADEDGNLITEADPAWDHFLASPPFPSYPSGHSTFSKASSEVLSSFFGTDAITFVAASDSLPGVFRTFHSLSECTEEVGMSRIYGGIHFMFDNVGGKLSGKRIGNYVSSNLLLPNTVLPLVLLEGVENTAPRVRVHGHVGQRCILEASEDLVVWQGLATNRVMATGDLYVDHSADGHRTRFYRARED
jgi:hypothetical protein